MQHAILQPDAVPISGDLVSAILQTTLPSGDQPVEFSVAYYGHYSNDVADVQLRDGRRLIVKRGRYPWARARFQTSRLAADLLRQKTDLVTPHSLGVQSDVDERPLDVYWRIDLPTLLELWPRLRQEVREETMRGLGEMIQRVHRIRLQGHGELRDVGERPTALSSVLAEEIGGRLLPAAVREWPKGVPVLQFLLGMIPELARRVGPDGVLLHGDLHMGNVLCTREGESVRCVGLLDLESAQAGPPEGDLARLSVLHSDLFEMPVDGAWMDWLLDGYEDCIDQTLYRFYVVYHLARLGFHSASVGHNEHADNVALAASIAIAELPECGFS